MGEVVVLTAAEVGPYLHEAIHSLGYVKPECESELAQLLEANFGQHPHQIARMYRKSGEQIGADEKRALGLRSNAFFSRAAKENLTDKGLKQPKRAFEITLLRAMFSFFRSRAIEQARAKEDWYIRAERCHGDCTKRLDFTGKNLSADDLSPLPPDGCEREDCSLHFAPRCDYLARTVREIRAARGLPPE